MTGSIAAALWARLTEDDVEELIRNDRGIGGGRNFRRYGTRTGRIAHHGRRTPADLIERRIAAADPALSPGDMIALLETGRGRRKTFDQVRHDEIARVVAYVMSAPKRLPPAVDAQSLAAFLKCPVNTVYRLRAKGRKMQNERPISRETGSESRYWGFRGWTPVPDPNDPFQTLYAPPARAAAVVPLKNLTETETPDEIGEVAA